MSQRAFEEKWAASFKLSGWSRTIAITVASAMNGQLGTDNLYAEETQIDITVCGDEAKGGG